MIFDPDIFGGSDFDVGEVVVGDSLGGGGGRWVRHWGAAPEGRKFVAQEKRVEKKVAETQRKIFALQSRKPDAAYDETMRKVEELRVHLHALLDQLAAIRLRLDEDEAEEVAVIAEVYRRYWSLH